MKRLAILGSTGSIGRQTLEVVRAFPQQFTVTGLAAGHDSQALQRQVEEFHPLYVSAADRAAAPAGQRGLVDIEDIVQQPDVDIVVVAIPGVASLGPALAAIRAGKTVALASKEVLVVAGEMVTNEAMRSGARLYPVDSEHSAIWQCLQGEEPGSVRRLILTASGGPFRHMTLEQLGKVTKDDALRHPTWDMGPKVTVDSATLLNKGLEVIEARWLYDIPYDRIDVVVHPQSIVHSLVEFTDGSCKAQMGYPDMRLPIQYALTYPDRWPNERLRALNLIEVGNLSFEAVDEVRFPCFRLARQAGEEGGTYPAVLQAAGEAAVRLFLEDRLSFLGVAALVRGALESHLATFEPALEDLLGADAWARAWVEERSGAITT